MSVESSLKLVYSTMYEKNYQIVVHTLREKCPKIWSFFYFVFSRIRTEYGETRSISPYSVRMRENKLRIWTLFTQSHSSKLHWIKAFLLISLSHSKLSRKLSSHLKKRDINHSRRQHFFKNLFPSTAVSSGGNYDLL